MVVDNRNVEIDQQMARQISIKRRRLLDRAATNQEMTSGEQNIDVRNQNHINGNLNIQKQLSRFEEALDTSFQNEDLAKTKEEPKIENPKPLKVTLSKNQVKLNSNYFINKENQPGASN